jgi:hypothetical protein
MFTKNCPEQVPVSLLHRLLAEDTTLNYVSVLCVAAMLVRIDPALLLTQGFQHVLFSTELALERRNVVKLNAVTQSLPELAGQIWQAVAVGDPAALLPYLEYYVTNAGWQKHTSHLLAQKIVKAANRHDFIIHDAMVMFVEMQKNIQDSDTSLPSPAFYCEQLFSIRVKWQRKTDALEIANQLNFDHSVPSAVAPVQQAVFRPDPIVDQLVAGYLSTDPEQHYHAKEQLKQKLDKPTAALVEGLCQAALEIVQTYEDPERCSALLATIYFVAKRHPEFIPIDLLQAWIKDEAQGDETLLLLFSILAQGRPDWIVQNQLTRSLAAAVYCGDLFATGLLICIGYAYPQVVLQFINAWFGRNGYSKPDDKFFIDVLESLATKNPGCLDEVIHLLQSLAEASLVKAEKEEDESVWIDLDIDRLSTRIQKLKNLKTC